MLPILRILLGPLLLWQGRGVRASILRMPEGAGPRTGTIGAGAPLRLLVLGDSVGASVGAPTQAEGLSGQVLRHLSTDHAVTYRVLATTGWTTADTLAALPELGEDSFDVAVISVGVNDITTENGIKTWLVEYQKLLDQLATRHRVALAVLLGMPPMGRFPALPQPLRWYLGQRAQAHDAALADFTADHAIALHVPIRPDLPPEAAAEDGFHPGPPFYEDFGVELDALIRANLHRLEPA